MKIKPKQETLSQFETRKGKIKFGSLFDVYAFLNREFNNKGLFYKYYKYFEYLQNKLYGSNKKQ